MRVQQDGENSQPARSGGVDEMQFHGGLGAVDCVLAGEMEMELGQGERDSVDDYAVAGVRWRAHLNGVSVVEQVH